MYLIIRLDLPPRCKQNASGIQLDVSEIYFRCNSNVFNHRPRQGPGCKQNAFEKHLDVSDIHLKIALNSHVHKLYKPRWVKKLWIRQPFKD